MVTFCLLGLLKSDRNTLCSQQALLSKELVFSFGTALELFFLPEQPDIVLTFSEKAPAHSVAGNEILL